VKLTDPDVVEYVSSGNGFEESGRRHLTLAKVWLFLRLQPHAMSLTAGKFDPYITPGRVRRWPVTPELRTGLIKNHH
jgi:hypothetical protein